MKILNLAGCVVSAAVVGITAVDATAQTAPSVPAALRPPAGQVLAAETLATGVQIYECAGKSDQPGTFEWVFRSPEAALADRSGRSVGKHYAGPTWESTDGSIVSGEVAGRDPGPSPAAIPWLLLKAKTNSGKGVFSDVVSIQRLQTAGGIAPTEACNAANLKQLVRVPYTATYYFYRAATTSSYSSYSSY